MKLIMMKIDDIKPYDKNPRRNDDAVEDVAESIRQCKYNSPVVVDENGVILCGHTRLKALKRLGYNEVEVIQQVGLTDEQKRKYRLLDNKTAEKSQWDYDQLVEELDGLDFDGFDFGFDENSTGISVSDMDSLFADAPQTKKEPRKIQCPHCGEWLEI